MTAGQVLGPQGDGLPVPEVLLLYVVRHGALYYALSKWYLIWVLTQRDNP